MRVLLLCSTLMLVPIVALSEPQCVLQAPPANVLNDKSRDTGEVGLPAALGAPGIVASTPLVVAPSWVSIDAPVLDHVAASGSHITDAGLSHGLRTVVARNDGQFIRMYVSPDGQALVAGLMSELSASDLLAMAPGQVKELGIHHGLRGIFVRNGTQFQVFYATPNGQRVIPGAMFDAAGKNLTRDHVSSIPGAIPTVMIGNAPPGPPAQAPISSGSPIKAIEGTTYGTVGSPSAPRLWVFIDPLCAWSVRAMEQLRPYVASGRLQLAVIPVSVLDHEDGGRSTLLAKAMLSLPQEAMIPAWSGNKLTNTAEPAAAERLATNQAISKAIGLRGTPTILWRKADGAEGRADGLPGNLDALVASIGGRP